MDKATRELLTEIVDAYWRWDAANTDEDVTAARIDDVMAELLSGMQDAVEELDNILRESDNASA